MTREEAKKLDRRVIRTRKAIMDAFDKLIAEGSIGHITVSAIAREANIDRKTFYLHYSSVNELANHKTEIALERIFAARNAVGPDASNDERVRALLDEVNTVILEDVDVYANIASTLSIDQFFDRVATSSDELGSVGDSTDITTKDMRDLTLQFNVAGALSLYKSWLVSDHSMPIEQVSLAVETALNSTCSSQRRA